MSGIAISLIGVPPYIWKLIGATLIADIIMKGTAWLLTLRAFNDPFG